MDRNKPLFTLKERLDVCANNMDIIEKFRKTKNIKEWNHQRMVAQSEFKGTKTESLIFFGYIDGELHSDVHGKKLTI